MTNLDQAVESIADELGLDKREIELRKAALDITDDDVALLQQLHEKLTPHLAHLNAVLDRHLEQFQSQGAGSAGDELTESLKAAQNIYFDLLTAGSYDADYAKSRMQLGVVRHRIGVAPKWTIAAYRKYLAELQALLPQLIDDPLQLQRTGEALLKVGCLDLLYAVDIHIAAERQDVLADKLRSREELTLYRDALQAERQKAEAELQHMANHDVLTSLPNRSLLIDRMTQAITYANRLGEQVAVLLLDLDRFKNVNDSLGHDVGDKMITAIAKMLQSKVRDVDTVARLGGDEFVILIANVVNEDAVAILAQQMLSALAQPLTIHGQELYPAGSIGISLYPKDGADSQALLKNADTAMYRAKDAGRNNFQFYARAMNARALDRLKLEAALRNALLRNEFVLHYQPQMDIASGAIVGVEALLRWQPPHAEMIYPADFIPIAEETGLIVGIGEWVLRTACAQRQAWARNEGHPPLRMAINLSARQFKQQDIAKTVSRALEESGCEPGWLELEITESVLMDNPEAAAATLQKLSDMGVHLSIDDFGTGYSSLAYLKRFPIHTLKIDRSFVSDITCDADDAAIAKAVIALAHSMKLRVIAEGVESREQLDFLRGQMCDQMQGYHLSQPLPARLLENLLQAHATQAVN